MSNSASPSAIILSGRPRKRVPTVDWKIVIPADVAVLVEEALPGRGGKTKYGARAELIELLLRRWLSENDIKGGFDETPREVAQEERATDPPSPSSPPPLSDKDFTR